MPTLKSCFTESQRRATNVLTKVKLSKERTKDISVRGWMNGREHGYIITAYNWSTGGADLCMAVAECRNSDDIVVFKGTRKDFDYTTGAPSDDADRIYFRNEAEAASYITRTLEDFWKFGSVAYDVEQEVA